MVRSITLVVAVIALVSCVDPPTSVLLEVKAESGLAPLEALSLTLFEAGGVVVKARRLPEQGALELPGNVVLYPKADSGELRILVQGLASTGVVGEGTTRVTLARRAQISASVTLAAGRQPDGDGDGVPDTIDNCPEHSNPQQQPCDSDAGPGDGGVEQDLIASDLISPDQDCDKDKDSYASAACGGTDCDDSLATVNPGAKEGPAGSAVCSDGVDNDCNGLKDLTDSSCVACTGDTECDDKLSCTTDTCSGGVCKHVAANEGKPCTENQCVTAPKCTAGQCTGAVKTCPPATNPCQAAACDPSSGCYLKNLADGSSCSDGDPCTTKEACTAGACVDPSASPTCYISGKCYADKQILNTCLRCDVSRSKTGWSIVSTYCHIGGTCRANGYKPNACQVCTPTSSQTSYTTISGYCAIGGTCYSSGAAGSGCLLCNPTISAVDWTAKPSCGVVLVALNSGFTGDLGGIAGADTKCQTQATAAGLTGVYKAVLSATAQDAKAVLPAAFVTWPVYNSRGEQLYSSWNSMWSPSKWPSSKTIYSFAGKKVDEGLGSAPDWDDADAWHGSTTTGALRTGYTCTDWTVATGNGSVGEIDMNTFTTLMETRACSLTLAVICVRIPPAP